MISCSSMSNNRVTPQVFQTDYKNARVYRGPNESVKCSDPNFEGFTCMKNFDFMDMVTELIYLRSKDSGDE